MADYLEDLGADMDDMMGFDSPDEYDDLADLGAAAMVKAGVPPARARAIVKRRNIRRLQTRVPGSQAQGARLWPLPIGSGSFILGGATFQTFRVETQKLFRGQRLVTDHTRTGATATGLLTITDLVMGTTPQAAAIGPLPFAAFSPNANGVELDLDPIQPGIQAIFTVAISALPAGTDRVDFAWMLLGESLR